MPDRIQNRISAINSPHELALGITFGVVIGIMPKDSAIPWCIALLFLFSRGNLLCGILAALAMSAVGPWLDPWTNKFGESVLTVESLQPIYASWMDLPLVAWTRFNNTVVAGTLVTGLACSLPVYLLSQVFFRQFGIALIQRLMQMPLVRLIFGDSENSGTPDLSDSPLISES